ncbi:hypothetical protein K8I28_07985 [bacterium]|nr:hypothetical protein [bacterium]
MNKFRAILRNFLLVTVPTIILLLAFAELTFRFIIPASFPPYHQTDPNGNVMNYNASLNSDGLFTIGNFAQQRGRWHINNYGWNSPFDYDRSSTKPLVAIIGDSYVDGLQLDVDQKMSSLVADSLQDSMRVYSFGMAGAPFSQYLHVSRYVNTNFDPDILVFVVIHNDFDESHTDMIRNPLFMQIEDSAHGINEIPPKAYRPNNTIRMIRKSALVRYLYINLHAKEVLQGFINRLTMGGDAPEYNMNINVDAMFERLEDIKSGITYLIETILKENSDKRVIFIMDGLREEIYNNSFKNSKLMFLHMLMSEICASRDCEFIDMTPIFKTHYAKHKQRFETPYDNHWNKLGHELVANTVLGVLSSPEPE